MKHPISILTTLFFLVALAFPAMAAPNDNFPKIIPLPNGFRPEGVEVGRGHDIYAGSLANGSIYRADLRTGQGGLVVPPQTGRIAVGLAFDDRSNYIFVAGGPGGAGYVYDAGSGAALASYQFTTATSTFINDAVVTQSAAYFTDSFNPILYRVPLGPGGQLPDPSAITAIPLSGDYSQVAGFNVNGIDATPNGQSLIIVQSSTGKLYQVDPNSGQATLINLRGGSVPAGDGILLDGKTLYVMQNRLNKIAVIRLNPQLTAGEIVAEITDAAFRVPTTIAEFGNSIYAVNARFDLPQPPPTDADYDIVQVAKQK